MELPILIMLNRGTNTLLRPSCFKNIFIQKRWARYRPPGASGRFVSQCHRTKSVVLSNFGQA